MSATTHEAPSMVPSQRYPYNVYRTVHDAESSARQTLRPGSRFYVWRLAAGEYVWSVLADRAPERGARRVGSLARRVGSYEGCGIKAESDA